MGTAAGINTRRYHGLLIAALKPPTERVLLLSSIEASVQTDGEPAWISANQYAGVTYPEGYLYLESFSVDGLAEWAFRVEKSVIRKSVVVHGGRNAVTIAYRNEGLVPFLLTLRPLTAYRSYHANFVETPSYPESLTFPKGSTVVAHAGSKLLLLHPGAQRIPVEGWYYRFEHRREIDRGLDPRDDLFCPCELRYEVPPGEVVAMVASLGEQVAPEIRFIADESERSAAPRPVLSKALKEAASIFLVEGGGRDTILAGYPWFTDWGRDTMIAIPGVCLLTGRVDKARSILRGYAAHLKEGLIPNRFLECGAADYNTCDATLWFGYAIHKTLDAEWDQAFAEEMLAVLTSVYQHHRDGTLYGIKMDPKDGLLTQGVAGEQLTWMDAKIGAWVVTPRHGKPVEINGLWVNFLRVLEWLMGKVEGTEGLRDEARVEGRRSKVDLRRDTGCPTASDQDLQASEVSAAASRAEAGFKERFWIESKGHYFDTIDPEDASLRPNQVIAMALPFGPATGEQAVRALQTVERELLTPVGLRTLGPREPGYRGRFEGPLPEMDAAYHQGTVWPWLLGPYVSALVRLMGDKRQAKQALSQVREMLGERGLGGIAEVYDGDPPHRPNGCPWQAWSVAEILRAWIEDAGGA
jgi:predicted glycogen debranching enzyme